MKKYFNLQLFDNGGEGGSGGSQGGNAGDGNGSQGNAGNNGGTGGYSFQQAEEIAQARAERAEKAALSSYFKQQGMSEEEMLRLLAADGMLVKRPILAGEDFVLVGFTKRK